MAWLHQLLGGSSPITGYFGTAVMILTVLHQVLTEQGPPQDLDGWVKFLGAFFGGLGIRLAKDANKSHAQEPMPVAQPVRAAEIEPPYQVP